jgi:hypothetical protein
MRGGTYGKQRERWRDGGKGRRKKKGDGERERQNGREVIFGRRGRQETELGKGGIE